MNTATSWKDALPHQEYLDESLFMLTVPLAKNGGMTSWILVDQNAPPGQRQIFSSCESFRKRALRSDEEGTIAEGIIHGIASVFCPEKYRGHGYPKRMMQELGKRLSIWQSGETQCIGSILYSDIGKSYYTQLGWNTLLSNLHFEIRPSGKSKSSEVHDVEVADLPDLCRRDEALLRKRMAAPSEDSNVSTRVSIIADLDHIGWHLAKEEFACNFLFGRIPQAKGAIAGPPGSQVWAIWTHRYYDHPNAESPNNVLYILRIVMEVDDTATCKPSDLDKMFDALVYNGHLMYLKAVLEAAQAEAFNWKLGTIQLWDPTPLIQHMVKQMNIEYKVVERQEEAIGSVMWYGAHGDVHESAPLWVNNEHYAWC
jgi:hypothetical protein